jgi:hypothetical protein
MDSLLVAFVGADVGSWEGAAEGTGVLCIAVTMYPPATGSETAIELGNDPLAFRRVANLPEVVAVLSTESAEVKASAGLEKPARSVGIDTV